MTAHQNLITSMKAAKSTVQGKNSAWWTWLASAVHHKVSKTEADQGERIAQMVWQEVAKSGVDNNPPLPEGNDYVTLDEHLSDELIADIANDKYTNLSKLSTPSSVHAKEKYNVVYDKQGNKVLKPVKNSKEIDNIFEYLHNMFILGACYLRPQFLQYLFNILEDKRHFKFKPVMTYNEAFRTHREKYPNFSWVWVHKIPHTALNKYHNVRLTGSDYLRQVPTTKATKIQTLTAKYNSYVNDSTKVCVLGHASMHIHAGTVSK